jgi:RNase P protein component
MNHAYQALTTEGHAHARSRLRLGVSVARRKVIEQATQRRIKRDPHNGARQAIASKVFHSACG